MIKRLREDEFIRHNFVFFIGSLAVAFLNYLYHPVLGRMMDIKSFGEVQTVISLSLLFGMVIGVFRNIIINIVANARQIEEKQQIILMLQKTGLYIVLAMAALILVFIRQLRDFLNFSSFYPFICLAVTLILSLFFTFRSSILQAKQRFTEVSLAGIFLSAGRLVFAVILVMIGWGTFGAIAAIVISQFIALVYVYAKTKTDLSSLTSAKVRITSEIKKELAYGLLAFLVTLSVTFLYSVDIIIVKHYFSAEVAGYYSGIATIARIIFFLTGSVAGVLISHVKLESKLLENQKILAKGLFLVIGMGGAALLTFSLFPDIIIKLLIGQRYVDYAGLLPRLSLLLFFVSIINVVFTYYLSLRKYFLSVIAVASIAAILLLSHLSHGSPLDIINNFLWVSIAILAIFCVRSGIAFAKYAKTNFDHHTGLQRTKKYTSGL